jgi:hypothetical protein
MSRKGGQAETECKKKLIAEYGQHNVFKIAIGGAVDFIIVKEGRLLKAVTKQNIIANQTKKINSSESKHSVMNTISLVSCG